MTGRDYPDLTRLYRWPFGIDDNPNVVIEPTANCNLHCPHCYRESNNPHKRHAVMALTEVREYIDEALRLRRFQTLSFLGGEPLLYPHLDEAILYGVNKGLSVGLYTNGLILSRYRARELKALGLSYIYVHVDRHQGRDASEESTSALRQHFCDMFRKLGGLNFGFGVVLDEADLANIERLAAFLQNNADVVRFVNLSLLGPASLQGAGVEEMIAECRRVDDFQRRALTRIREAFGFEYCSYLGSKFRADTPGKILAVSAYRGGRLLGSMDSDEFRGLSEDYRQEHGNYPYLLSKKCTDHFRRCHRFGDDVHWQYVAVSLSPLLLEERVVNICDSCTDCVLYQGHFVPMCLLEQIRGGDPLVLESVRYW